MTLAKVEGSKPGLSAFSAQVLAALQRLTRKRQPHPCGGFTTDDIEWQMGTAFTPKETWWETLDELTHAGLVRYAGYDEDDAIGHCYELVKPAPENFFGSETKKISESALRELPAGRAGFSRASYELALTHRCPECGEEWSKPHCPKCAEERGVTA